MGLRVVLRAQWVTVATCGLAWMRMDVLCGVGQLSPKGTGPVGCRNVLVNFMGMEARLVTKLLVLFSPAIRVLRLVRMAWANVGTLVGLLRSRWVVLIVVRILLGWTWFRVNWVCAVPLRLVAECYRLLSLAVVGASLQLRMSRLDLWLCRRIFLSKVDNMVLDRGGIGMSMFRLWWTALRPWSRILRMTLLTLPLLLQSRSVWIPGEGRLN